LLWVSVIFQNYIYIYSQSYRCLFLVHVNKYYSFVLDGDLEIMVSVCAKKSLNHEQQRRIELKCIELEAMLEEQGY